MSNLLEKASILLTPTAYDDGKILSVKPEEVLGEELVVNGDFSDGSTSWNFGPGWSIVNENASHTGSGSYIEQGSLTQGVSYKVVINVTQASGSGFPQIYMGGLTTAMTSVGVYTFNIVAVANDKIKIRGLNDCEISSVSVKQEIDGDFDFTRNSSATRVNSQGLIEDVQILSSNLVSNGDFSQEGSELIINGDFSNGVNNWAQGSEVSSFTVTNGIATIQGNASSFNTRISQSISVTIGKTYKITGEIKSNDAGDYRVRLFNGSYLDITNGNNSEFQTFTYYHNATASTAILYLSSYYSNGSADFSIDNVSVKEVGQDWTLSSAWNIGTNKAIFSDATGGDIRTSSTVFTANKKYQIKLTVADLTSGTAFFALGAGAASNLVTYANYANGEHTFNVTAPNSLELRIYSTTSSGSSYSISNISVIEITDDTNLPRINYEGFSYQDSLGSELVTNGDFSNGSTGWTIINGTVTDKYNASMTAYQSGIRIAPFSNTGTFKVVFDLVVTSGSCKFDAGGVNNAIFNTSGTKEIIVTNTTKFEFNAFNLGWVGTLDNVSVKEYLGQEVVPDSGCGSWLFEPQSTNLLTYSEQFDNASWINNGVTINANQVVSPDGSLTADLLTGVSGGFGVVRFSTWTSTNKVASCFAKKGSTDLFKIANASGGVGGVTFNLENGTITNEDSGFEGEIENYGNGWFRCTAIDTLARSGTLSLGVTAASESIYIWGAQLESGYKTSYIPTSGSTVTRLQDAAFGSGSSDLINSTEGVLYAEIAALADNNIKKGISISNGTTSNRIILRYGNQSNKIEYIVVGGGAIQANMNISSFNILNYLKIAIKWKLNYFALWINGVEVRTDTVGITFPVDTLNQLNFDSTTTEPFYGKVKCLAVFKEALTDAELTCLTTI